MSAYFRILSMVLCTKNIHSVALVGKWLWICGALRRSKKFPGDGTELKIVTNREIRNAMDEN